MYFATVLSVRPIELPHARKFIDQSQRIKDNNLNVSSYVENLSSSSWEKCNVLNQRSTKITTNDEYSNFDFQVCFRKIVFVLFYRAEVIGTVFSFYFQPEWMKTKEYWDKSFETRYEKLKKDDSRPPLKVLILLGVIVKIEKL